MQIIKAHYKDRYHDTFIEIENTQGEYVSDPFSFTLDGVRFVGTSLTDFEPAEGSDTEKACEKFDIFKSGGFELDVFGAEGLGVSYTYELCRYSLEADMPVRVVRRSDNSELEGQLRISFEYKEHDPEKPQGRYICDNETVYHDDLIIHCFALMVDGKEYPCSNMTPDFETALSEISRLMADEYYLKCCFTCRYSDYSPYGNDDFGTMQCFKDQKEEYLKVNTKMDYFEHLDESKCTYRQETYLCEEYAVRNKAGGYRGYVEGVY